MHKKKRTGKLRFKKYKVSARGWIAFTMLMGVLTVSLFIYFTRPTVIDKLSLTYLDNLTSDSLAYDIPSSYEQNYLVSDYTIYGESLVLYHEDYLRTDYDDLYGKNVMLKNLETGQELTYTFNGGADSGIALGDLEPGVYEIYVYDQFTKKRVFAADSFEAETFTTMRRNKEVTSINLGADADYLSKFGIQMDRNYLFLTVTSSLPKVKITDVLIDPSGLVSYLNSPGVDEGYDGELISEQKTSYQFAMQIQSYLEEYGLKAEISRSADEGSGYYGQNSRVGQGYDSQAKVFLGLTMSETEISRPYILCSPYTNGLLANEIAYTMARNGIQLASVSSLSRLNAGVGYDSVIVDENYELTNWTLYPQIRETGGKVTYAGTGSSWTANSLFSDSYGMYGVLVCYASVDDEDSQAYFLANQEAMARSIAQAIASYFDIPELEGAE